MPADHLTDLGLSCPDGGDFYVCAGNSTEFIGCCTSDPCSDGGGDCPTRNLRASSFSPDRYANIPAQSCDDNRREKVWYTCADNSPPFLGCCASNPCGDGCPRDHLIAAVLSDDDVDRLAFLEPNSTSPSTSATSTPSTTPTSSPSSAPEPSSSGLGTGAIAGIAVAGAAALLIIIALLWFCRRRALKKRAQQTPMTYHGSMPTSPAYPGMRDSHMSAATTAIPHSYHTTPTSPDFPKTYAHYAHPHQHQQQYPSSPPPHSVFSQFTDGEGGGYGPAHARHVSQMSGVSGMTEQQQHQALFPVSEIDGVEREAPRVELPATEVSTKR